MPSALTRYFSMSSGGITIRCDFVHTRSTLLRCCAWEIFHLEILNSMTTSFTHLDALSFVTGQGFPSDRYAGTAMSDSGARPTAKLPKCRDGRTERTKR